METLLAHHIATAKMHVQLRLRDGRVRDYSPGEWLGRAPWNVQLKTLHVDRSRLGAAMDKLAMEAGVQVERGLVHSIDSSGDRIHAVTLIYGRRMAAPWFGDASGGQARLLPRHFALQQREYGPAKAAMWDYFNVTEAVEGTTLNGELAEGGYMEWVWQIPVRQSVLSVGYIAPGDSVKSKRQQGRTAVEIYREQLETVRELTPAQRQASTPRVRSFRCRVSARAAGENWVIVGESAAMIDPMTSNGVTHALRSAREAAQLIRAGRYRHRLPRLAAALYSMRLTSMAGFFNQGIESIIYGSPVRAAIGAPAAGNVYTVPAWCMNLVYSRLRPRGVLKTLPLVAALAAIRIGLKLLHGCCARLQGRRPLVTAEAE